MTRRVLVVGDLSRHERLLAALRSATSLPNDVVVLDGMTDAERHGAAIVHDWNERGVEMVHRSFRGVIQPSRTTAPPNRKQARAAAARKRRMR